MSKAKITRICPNCGKHYNDVPATSRKDNKTEICPMCGTLEAVKSMPFVIEKADPITQQITGDKELKNLLIVYWELWKNATNNLGEYQTNYEELARSETSNPETEAIISRAMSDVIRFYAKMEAIGSIFGFANGWQIDAVIEKIKFDVLEE